MSQTLAMPKLGLTMTEGQVAEWRRAPGDPFAAGDVLVVIETDKIANEVEAPSGGVLIEPLVPEGAVVPVSAPIARWRLDGELSSAAALQAASEGSPHERGQPRAPLAGEASRTSHGFERSTGHATASAGRIRSTPFARRLAREAGIDIAAIAGSGPNGRIKAVDITRTIEMRERKLHSRPLPDAEAGIATSPDGPRRGAGDFGPGSMATALERAGRPQAGPRILSLAQIEVDTRGLREIERSVPAHPGEPLRLALVVTAATRAIYGLLEGAVGIETAAAGHGAAHVPLDVGARAGLRAVAAAIASAISSARAKTNGGALLIAQGSEHIHIFAPAAPDGWDAILGLGAEREALRRAPDGAIGETHTMTLALSYDAAAIPNPAALTILSRMKQLLDEPLTMLAG